MLQEVFRRPDAEIVVVSDFERASRLDEAASLYHQGYAHLIVVTGSKEPKDKCTEAESGAMYLEQIKRVPSSAIVQAGGNNSY